MSVSAAIVLAGGRSSRMGSSKAALDWHGSTLVRRVSGLVARAVDGPVVVVRARDQTLPELDPAAETVADAREGRGPLQGLAAGLGALRGRAEVAYVTATDVPLLHPAFVRCVLAAWSDEVDVVLPRIDGHRQTLAAAYRVGLADLVEDLVAAERLKPAFLFERCHVLDLEEADVRAEPAVARADPRLDSVHGLNEPADYARALELPAPRVAVVHTGTPASGPDDLRTTVSAWSLGQAASAVGLTLDDRVVVTISGEPARRDPQVPLVMGDLVTFTIGGEARPS